MMVTNSRLAGVGLLILTLICAIHGCADQAAEDNREQTELGSAAWIVDQFFVQDSFPNAREYLTGEALQMYERTGGTIGEGFPPGIQARARQVRCGADECVYAIAAGDTTASMDIYGYLSREQSGWKLTAMRSLAAMNILGPLIAQLDSLPSVPDSLKFNYENGKLIISSDAKLKTYLTDNMDEFEAIIGPFLSGVLATRVYSDSSFGGPPEYADEAAARQVRELLARLYLHTVGAAQDAPGCLDVMIGGVVDNTVGYLYVPEGASLPRMNPNQYILVEKIFDRWYLYKTT
jgi:hypothetical protein